MLGTNKPRTAGEEPTGFLVSGLESGAPLVMRRDRGRGRDRGRWAGPFFAIPGGQASCVQRKLLTG